MNRVATLSLAAVGTLTLAGCVSDVPPPVTSAPPMAESAALLEPQSTRVIDATMEELAAADDALDTELFTDRVGGQVTTVRGAEYTLAKADDGPEPEEIPADMQAVYVSGVDTWPRLMATVTEQPSEEATPVVMLWVQDSIDDDYQLRGWAHMVPGATIPAMAGPATGATQPALDDSTISPTPQKAIEDYLELLRQGPDSDLNEEFAPDSYREQLFASREALTEAAEDSDGKYVDTVQSDIDQTYVMGTADGGALVFAPVRIASSFTVEDATVSIRKADRPLLEGKLDDQVTHHFADMVVIAISGPGVDTRPTVVAADHNLVRVSDS